MMEATESAHRVARALGSAGRAEKIPRVGSGWEFGGYIMGDKAAYRHASGMIVLAEFTMMSVDGMEDIATMQHLVSLSVPYGRRPNDRELRMVRRDFDMADAEEDNHEPGRARKLFLIADPELRAKHAICACKDTEIQHVEPDGYRWSEVTKQ